MTWIKLDSGFPDHPKVVAAGWKAAWLYVCGLTYCSRYLTDGRIPKAQVKRLSDVPKPEGEAARLVAAGLWIDDDEHYVVHDYTVWQSSAEKVEREREEGRKRAAASAEARAKKRKPPPEVRQPDVEVEIETSSSPPGDEHDDEPDAAEEEEEDDAMREARRRLLCTTANVTDPTAWVSTTAKRLRDEGWTKPTPKARHVVRCEECNDLPIEPPCEACAA